MVNFLNKFGNLSSPINDTKKQFSEDKELVQDLKTILNDLTVRSQKNDSIHTNVATLDPVQK